MLMAEVWSNEIQCTLSLHLLMALHHLAMPVLTHTGRGSRSFSVTRRTLSCYSPRSSRNCHCFRRPRNSHRARSHCNRARSHCTCTRSYCDCSPRSRYCLRDLIPDADSVVDSHEQEGSGLLFEHAISCSSDTRMRLKRSRKSLPKACILAGLSFCLAFILVGRRDVFVLKVGIG